MKRRDERTAEPELAEHAALPPMPPPEPDFLPVTPLPGMSVCSVVVDGVEIARATYDREASIIQCRREGVPKGAGAILRRIAKELGK